MAAGTTVRLVLPSQIRLVDLVHSASEKMAHVAGLPDDEALDAALAVREAVINAVVHGNRSDPAREVEVTLVANGTGFTARVLDQGAGFDPAATPDPTTGENRLKNSGRGLLLVRAFVDDVGFRYRKGRGMEVTLVKRIRPSGGADAGRP